MTTSKVNFVNIPQELKNNASFCVWKMEKRQGKPTKVPYNPKTGALARTNDPSTFSDFGTAMKTYALGGWDGIGYRVSEGIGAIDIDHCIREDGSLNDVAASIMSFFPDAYFERSPSGTGLRGFFRLSPDFAYDKTVYYINNRKHGLEVYLPGATNRFVTVTGDVYRSGSVTRNDEALQNALDTFMRRANRVEGSRIEACSYLDDDAVIEHASRSESGEKFKMLYEGHWEEGYDSQSDADMALVSILAFWCGNVEEQIDRIFRTSGLMREKWDRRTGDSTYGQITIRNAVASNDTIYVPMGFNLFLSYDSFSKTFKMRMEGTLSYRIDLGEDVYGNITRMDNALASIPARKQGYERTLSELHDQEQNLKEELNKPFPQEDELREKTDRLTELDALLNLDKHESDTIGEEDEDREEESPERSNDEYYR